MNTLKIGDLAPDFAAPRDGGGTIFLADHAGKPVVLYFYPKDDTPGCTKEAIGFTEAAADFAALGATVIGVSKDSVKKHDKFVAKYNLEIMLISDEDGNVCENFGVWVAKSMYGKTYMGIERATYLIGVDGKIAQIWRKVKVPGHVEAVLTALREQF